MAFDEALADRVRDALSSRPNTSLPPAPRRTRISPHGHCGHSGTVGGRTSAFWRLSRNMSDKRARVDLDVSKIADRQHGVLSTVQLNAAGLDKHGVLHRVRTGRLHRVHWGVYAVGHSALPWEAQWMAAVLACGRVERVTGAVLDFWGAALSHRSAACLWGMLTPRDGPIDVSVPGYGGKRRRRASGCIGPSRSYLHL
jgi:hypothetical protein